MRSIRPSASHDRTTAVIDAHLMVAFWSALSARCAPRTAPPNRCPTRPGASMISPPPVPRDNLVEELHGHKVADPYRWLEAGADDPGVADFIRQQNDHSRQQLAELPD